MKFFCKLIMGETGDFPGAPDTDHWEVTEETYDRLLELMEGAAIRQVNRLDD